MNAQRDVELMLRAHFEITADRTVADGQVEGILSTTAGRRQQPAWLASFRSHPMTTTARSFGRLRFAPAWALLLILALLIAVVAVGLTVGGVPFSPSPIANGPIVFSRQLVGGGWIAYSMRPDGSSARVLLTGENNCPKLSPDGRRVAVDSAVADIDGSHRTTFPKTPGNLTLGCPSWSPDGKRLAFEAFNEQDAGDAGVVLADSVDGGSAIRLTSNDMGGTDAPGDFSLDGRFVSFVRGQADQTRGSLWIVDVRDGTARRISSQVFELGTSWSPDGQWIVGASGLSFILVRPDGSESRVLGVPADIGELGPPSFSPDGQRLVFTMALPGAGMNKDVYSMRIDGTDLVQLTDTPNDVEYFVDWGIDPK